MKNILMITPFFAPYSHAAVYRAHRFAKYLPRFGWKPYVLTVDKSFLYFIDTALLDDLPKEVEIIRVRHPDLTFSGFKSLFKKPVTDSRDIKGPTSRELTAKLQGDKKNNFVINILDRFREKALFLPDLYITWYPFALERAKKISKSEHIDAIYSSSFPLTSHLIAMKLKSQFKIPWVADFREPGVEERRAGYRSSQFKYTIGSIIEKKVMREADLISTTCESARDLFLSKYKGIVDDKIKCVRHCVDTEILQSARIKEKSKKFMIVFAGEFLQPYNRKLFEFLKIIFERELFERNKVEVLIIGSIKRNLFLLKEIKLLGLSDVVKFVDFLSLNDYFGVLLSADATFLPSIPEYTFPIKLADYLFVKKPVIIFDSTSEVRGVLEKSGLNFFIPSTVEDGVKILLNLLRGDYKFDIDDGYINQFTAFNQTKILSDILTGLIEKNRQTLSHVYLPTTTL